MPTSASSEVRAAVILAVKRVGNGAGESGERLDEELVHVRKVVRHRPQRDVGTLGDPAVRVPATP